MSLSSPVFALCCSPQGTHHPLSLLLSPSSSPPLCCPPLPSPPLLMPYFSLESSPCSFLSYFKAYLKSSPFRNVELFPTALCLPFLLKHYSVLFCCSWAVSQLLAQCLFLQRRLQYHLLLGVLCWCGKVWFVCFGGQVCTL